jgi:hypothetical protein
MSYIFGNPLPPFYCDQIFLVAIGKGDQEFFDCHSIGDQNILVTVRVATKKIQSPYHVVIKNILVVIGYKDYFFNRHRVYDD